jgi:hypothetical protein
MQNTQSEMKGYVFGINLLNVGRICHLFAKVFDSTVHPLPSNALVKQIAWKVLGLGSNPTVLLRTSRGVVVDVRAFFPRRHV